MSKTSAGARWLVAGGLGWLAFAVITVTMVSGRLDPIDQGLAARVHGLSGGAAILAARSVAALGAFPAVTVAVALAAAGLWAQTRRGLGSAVMLVAAAATAGIVYLLKVAIGRVGPSSDTLVGAPVDFTFPSAPTTTATVVYVLATLLATRRGWRPLWRSVAVMSAVGLALLIGLSRICQGLDWSTDVLAGWLLAGGVICTAYGTLLLLDNEQTSRQRRTTIGSRPRPAH